MWRLPGQPLDRHILTGPVAFRAPEAACLPGVRQPRAGGESAGGRELVWTWAGAEPCRTVVAAWAGTPLHPKAHGQLGGSEPQARLWDSAGRPWGSPPSWTETGVRTRWAGATGSQTGDHRRPPSPGTGPETMCPQEGAPGPVSPGGAPGGAGWGVGVGKLWRCHSQTWERSPGTVSLQGLPGLGPAGSQPSACPSSAQAGARAPRPQTPPHGQQVASPRPGWLNLQTTSSGTSQPFALHSGKRQIQDIPARGQSAEDPGQPWWSSWRWSH